MTTPSDSLPLQAGRKAARSLSNQALMAAIPSDHARQAEAFDLARHLAGKGPLDVLDLGAGDGRSYDWFRGICPDVRWIGLDIEDSSEVRSRVRTDCTFMHYDGVRIPLPDASQDVVFSRQVFEHVRYPEAVMAEIVRVLRPGGEFIGSVSQLEPFHSRSYWNFTYFGFATIGADAGLDPVELRPGIDGVTLILRHLVHFAFRARTQFFRHYFARPSPLNLAIQAVMQPASLTPAERRDAARLQGFLSGAFPVDQFLPEPEAAARCGSIRDVNLTKLRYAGHVCFRFRRPMEDAPA